MTPYDIVRLKAAQALGLKSATDTSFTLADYQNLNAAQAQALDDLTALYMTSNPAGFTAGQVSAAQGIVNGPGFASRYAASYQAGATGFLATTKAAIAGVGSFAQSAAAEAVTGATTYLSDLKWLAIAGVAVWILVALKPFKKSHA